jgi:hypothetical protein
MKVHLLAFCLCLGSALSARADKMVPVPIPNGDCSDATLAGFRFRYDVEPVKQDQYIENHKWIKAGVVGGRKCVTIQAPAGVLAGPTAKVETAFLPIEPGATYRFLVDYYLDGTGTKMWAETCVVDPRPDAVREEEEAKGKRTTIFRFKPFKGLPALLMVHRAAAPELGKEEPQNWYTAEREFTIPAEWPVTLPFTIRGDGMATVFPVKAERKDDGATFEIIEVRLRTADQKLPYRQNKGQDYTINAGSISFVKPPPPGSETTVNVKWKLKPRYMSIKAIALGGADNSTAAFTNYRLFKTKEPGEAPAPVDGIVR